MKPRYFFLLTCQFLIFVISKNLLAQQTRQDTKGKRFFVAFMENLGNSTVSRLRLYAACEKPTKLKIILNKNFQNPIPYDIPKANTPIEIVIPYTLELSSANQGVSPNSVIVEAESEINLYGVNIRDKSSDAFVALPEKVLTPNYIILADTTGYDIRTRRTYDAASEFCCIATSDSTVLKIKPSLGLRLNRQTNNAPFEVTLQKGEVFFAQAKTDEPLDVSGTEVTANKPIAVFAGVRRAGIPVRQGASRDHLCEQMIPIENWGKNYIVTPHFVVDNSAPFSPRFRIVAVLDFTEWSINGVPQPPLRKGIPFGMEYKSAMYITAKNPILVAQYEPSSADASIFGGNSQSDPFMMIIPPVEQYDTLNVFQSIIDPEFDEHYINITIHKNGVDKLWLDGNKIDPKKFIQVANTDYRYAQINVSGGSHVLRGDSVFGLGVYGYGEVDSYGYTGSMVFKKLVFDTRSPSYHDTLSCGTVSGSFVEGEISDTGIDTVKVIRTNNVNVEILPYAKYSKIASFKGKLIDIFQDGNFDISGVDSVGRESFINVEIPGNTLRSVGMPVVLDTVMIINGAVNSCQDFEIENYGKYPQRIDELKLSDSLNNAVSNGIITILGGLPRTLQPNEKAKFTICVKGLVGFSEITSPITLVNGCMKREVAKLTMVTFNDTLPPEVLKTLEPCKSEINFSVVEYIGKGIGISEIKIDELINCEIPAMPDKSVFPNGKAEFKVLLKDKFKDGFIRFTTNDKIGNSISVTDTIYGFTIVAQQNIDNKELGNRFGNSLLLDTLNSISWRCNDTIKLFNYGLKPKVIGNLSLKNNTVFSIAPTLLPITILPNGYAKIPICVSGSKNDLETDSLIFGNGCDVFDTVSLSTNMKLTLVAGSDWCKNLINFNLKSNTTFVTTITPNPLRMDFAKAYVKLNQAEIITFEIFNSLGVCLKEKTTKYDLKEGISEIRIDLTDIPSGSYTLVYKIRSQNFYDKLIINH